ncbi:MAG: septal ring lytic transglycosylase RlpA family protein [Desulfovibrionaceae bacterium]|nr:septal ring lytic transglycosylase RlpA family protein [Desulfovibrionaceae bacterium]
MSDSIPAHDRPAARRLILLVLLSVLAASLLLAGCGTKKPAYKGPASTRPYTVRGVTYYPLASARGFEQTGTASWYGPSFHGRLTSSGERYNQNDLTAAHTVLPFHTNVEVTNLSNGKSVVVCINDRGPFARNRVIDLSRAAASRIDMIGPGTARVRIRALDSGDGEEERAPDSADAGGDGLYYIQVGAFGSQRNVSRAQARARRDGYRVQVLSTSGGLKRVLLGPWQSLDDVNLALWHVRDDYPEAFLVSDD